jgi:SecD/SecF fusion protein
VPRSVKWPLGRSEISGNFDVTETKDLANVLRAGKLPASADIVQSEVVGPSLDKSDDNGTYLAIVEVSINFFGCLFIMEKAGWYANIVSSKLTFLVWDLASLGAVLTLPGIAGIFNNGNGSRC